MLSFNNAKSAGPDASTPRSGRAVPRKVDWLRERCVRCWSARRCGCHVCSWTLGGVRLLANQPRADQKTDASGAEPRGGRRATHRARSRRIITGASTAHLHPMDELTTRLERARARAEQAGGGAMVAKVPGSRPEASEKLKDPPWMQEIAERRTRSGEAATVLEARDASGSGTAEPPAGGIASTHPSPCNTFAQPLSTPAMNSLVVPPGPRVAEPVPAAAPAPVAVAAVTAQAVAAAVTAQDAPPTPLVPPLPPPSEMSLSELQAELDAVPTVAAAALGSADASAATKNYTLWAEIVALRAEIDSLEVELDRAHATNERLGLILSGMSDRLRAQLEALLEKGVDTEERVLMFRQLKELLAYEEQLKQVHVQAQHAPTPSYAAPPSLHGCDDTTTTSVAASADPAAPAASNSDFAFSTTSIAAATAATAADVAAVAAVADAPLPAATPVSSARRAQQEQQASPPPLPPPPSQPLPASKARCMAAVSGTTKAAQQAHACARAAIAAADRRSAAEIAEARLLAKAAMALTRDQAEAAVVEVLARDSAVRAELAAAEEELRKERAHSRAERSAHAAEVERWKEALAAARAHSGRNTFDALASSMAAARPGPAPAGAAPEQLAAPVDAAREPGNGLLDQLVLTRHWDYLMRDPPRSQAAHPRQPRPRGRASAPHTVAAVPAQLTYG